MYWNQLWPTIESKNVVTIKIVSNCVLATEIMVEKPIIIPWYPSRAFRPPRQGAPVPLSPRRAALVPRQSPRLEAIV